MAVCNRQGFSPVAVYQYMAGASSARVRNAGNALAILLRSWGVPTKNIGTGFADAAACANVHDIPAHDDFVLIVHEDGNTDDEAYRHILSIAAPVLLLYHTPDDMAQLRRPSLQGWAMAKAVLGMDPMATLALRCAGFAGALDLNLALDDGRHVPETRRLIDPGKLPQYDIVAPGDLTPASQVLTILRAYRQFRQEWSHPSRLILLGRTLDAAIAKAVQDEIRSCGLQDEIVITGSLDANAQDAIFASAAHCVFLAASDILPEKLLRASASGLAVVAPPYPAISYRLGEAGLGDVVPPVAVDRLAGEMRRFADAPEELARLAAGQGAFRESAMAAGTILANALGSCGLALPVPRGMRTQLAARSGFIVAGHFEGSYSIATVNRMLALALEERRPGSVQVAPVAHHRRLDLLQEIPPQEDGLLQTLFARRQPNGAPVVAISQHFPPWVPDMPNDLALCLFTWEETLVPRAMVETLNAGFAGVMTVSRFVAKAVIDSGVRRPVKIVGQPVDVAAFSALAGRPKGADKPFTVLHVSSCFPRKGLDVLLQAWAQAFAQDEQVRLVIKTFPNPHQQVEAALERLQEEHPGLAPVELIDADLDAVGLRELFAMADCVALPTRGEGFNMVAAEAILAGCRLIVTGFGGHLDFAKAGQARLTDFRFAPSRSHVAAAGAFWAEPEVDDLVCALREAFAAHRNGRMPVLAPHEQVCVAASFDAAGWAEKIAGFAAELLCAPAHPLRRIAWISSWGVRCGIAEYSRELLRRRRVGPGEPEVLLLCDRRSAAASGPEIDGVTAIPVWTLGNRQLTREILPHLKSYEPQILLIQHQAGLISWEDLVVMLDARRGTASRIIVVLHSTEAILSLDHKLRATVLFSLSLVSRIIVHILRDLENLRELGVCENVTVLPHGAGKMLVAPKRETAAPRRPIVGCYGFFLPHKGIARLIEAFAAVLKDWPGARLRLVNAVFPSDVSRAEITSCKALARRLQVDHAIEWHLSYLEPDQAQILLSGCDLIVMPYDHTPESVSGAVRQALASGSPVAVSHSGIFDELRGAVHVVDAASTAALARDIAGLLGDAGLCRSVLQPAAVWLAQHDWDPIAQRLFDMAEGLWQARDISAFQGLVLTPKSRLLEHGIGRRSASRLIFSGEAEGFGLYGPYIDLGAGAYEVVFRFDRCSALLGEARFEATSQIDGRQLAVLERIFSDDGVYDVALRFELTKPVSQVEFRIFCHTGFQADFLSVSIELLAQERA